MADTTNVFEPWRAMRDEAMQAWAKAMVQTVNSDAYAQATGAMLDAYLAAIGPVREATEKLATQALEQANMPTRADVTSIAERLTNVETRLDDLDAKLDTLVESCAKLDILIEHTTSQATERRARGKAEGR